MLRLLGLIFLLFIAYSIFSDNPPAAKKQASTTPAVQPIVSPQVKAPDPEPKKVEMSDAECRKEIECYSAKFHANATVDCRRPVEHQSKNDFQWTDSWYEQKFDRRKWGDQAAGSVIYAGDHIKFQNGFGAWTHMKYFCTYDTLNKRVENVFAIEGQFD